MRAVLLTLSGDPTLARTALTSRYPNAEIVDFPRSAMETGSMRQRLGNLRSERADVFAVMTEALAWQYGQDALMLFGALAGARESIVVDARGGSRVSGRAALLAGSPVRIAHSFVRGKTAVAKAHKVLDRLEREVAAAEDRKFSRRSENSPTSIAYLRATPAAGTQPGGATSHINGVVNALVSLAAEIAFLSNDEIAGLNKASVSFQKIPPDPAVMPRSAFDVYNGMAFSAAVAYLIADSPPDFIYQRYSRFSWAGVEAGLRSNVPLFLEYNGSEVWIGKHWDRTEELELLERCERLNLRAASRIFVISEVERNNLLNAGVDDEKIIVNPNGVDADEFRPNVGGREARETLGIPADTTVAGFLGTFGPWHGVLALAEAIALTPKDASLHFVLIGDGSLRGEVERMLGVSGDLDRVTFTGSVSHDRVPAMLDACDILVSPHVPLADGSDFFGSPTKLFEYMSMGKGIVASRLGQIGDVLIHNETALLVEPGNAAELRDAILSLTRDEAHNRSLGETARSIAVSRHTWRQNAERVIEAFKSL